jgi:hypothetical protein
MVIVGAGFVGRLARVLCGVALVLLVATDPASAAGTLDQSQTTQVPAGEAGFVSSSQWEAQTFTAGITGQLDQVDLLLQRSGFPGSLLVEIRTVSAGTPTSTVLATATVPEASVSCCSFDWISVTLGVPVASAAGTQYAIVLGAPGASGCDPSGNCNNYFWGSALTNPYSAGTQVVSVDGGASWPIIVPDNDFAFKTYVTSAPGPHVPPPPPSSHHGHHH